MSTQSVSFWAALVSGLASFFSPCVLPLIPVYLGYMMGGVVPDGSANQRLLGLRHAALFVLGFALTFVTLGAAAGALGRWLYPAMPTIMRVAGMVLLVFGLQMLGILRLPFLAAETQVSLGRGRQGFWRSLLMGLAFAIGWSPCIGPVLSAILLMAAETRTAAQGALLLGVYVLGLGVPFLVAGVLVVELHQLLGRAQRVLAVLTRLGGLLVLAMGFLMVIGQFERVVFSLISG